MTVMYSMQNFKVPPSKATMKRMYSMNESLNGEDVMSSPKKDNVFQSIFSAWNVVWEHFCKVPGSWTSINNPLSITVVHNDGIISPDFFKSLTSRKEPITTDSMYIHGLQTKEPVNIVERIHCSTFDEKKYLNTIFDHDGNQNFKHSSKYLEATRSSLTGSSINQEPILKSSIEKLDISVESERARIIGPCNFSSENKTKDPCGVIVNTPEIIKDFEIHRDIEEKDTSTNKEIPNCGEISSSNNCHSSPGSNSTADSASIKPRAISSLLTNIMQRVIDGVSDRLYPRTEPVELEATMKRSGSPKQRRKFNVVAKCRRRGRARSQLRRSGVSQARLRKERSKHDLVVDIQDDFKSWQEFDSIDGFTLDENAASASDGTEFILQSTLDPVSYTFADIKPGHREPKTRKLAKQNDAKFPMRVRYVPEYTLDAGAYYQDYNNENKYDLHGSAYRPRLMSESSVDSEDSYCIVFETGAEDNYESDKYEEETDVDQSTEDEESLTLTQKVKFNLKPTVHVMVHWNYAYRAARRGPWEEMARDRERFKGRINCIGRVLNPILTVQHRNHIWQNRFAV